jgi:hypothetical protein
VAHHAHACTHRICSDQRGYCVPALGRFHWWRSMDDRPALWQPGIIHPAHDGRHVSAGVATQVAGEPRLFEG